MTNYSARLKRIRELLGYSQRELAAEFQVTSGAIANWESGTRPTPGPIKKLIEIYEKSLHHGRSDRNMHVEDAVQATSDISKLGKQILEQEGFEIGDHESRQFDKICEGFVKTALSSDPATVRAKIILAKKVIKSLSGSRGLALKAAQIISFVDVGMPIEIPFFLREIKYKGEPLSITQIQTILHNAYQKPCEKIFAKITPQPLAITSLAQLHRAVLLTGEEVVLKIRHPRIKELPQKHLEEMPVLSALGAILGESTKSSFEEIQKIISRETDFMREAELQERFHNLFKHESRIVIPFVHRQYCNEEVIASSYEPGLPLADFCTQASPNSKSQAGILLSYFMNYARFRGSLQYGDPSPTNFLFRKDQVVVFDFGRIFEMTTEEIDVDREMFFALSQKDSERFIEFVNRRNVIATPRFFDYDSFWQLMCRRYEHWQVDSLKFTRRHMRDVHLESAHFKDRKQLRFHKEAMRVSLVSWLLGTLFADLEAEGPWRDQLREILDLNNAQPLAISLSPGSTS